MKKRSAFSLIELSVVVLIIGILIAGVSQSSRLVKQARLKTARTLTTSSPAAGVSNLVAWYETSLESSFSSTQAYDATALTAWYDNSPQTAYKNNATGTATYYEYIFNGGIPSVRFNGTSNSMALADVSSLIASDYTVFVVEQRRATGAMYFLGGTATSTTANTNLTVGYSSSTAIAFYQGGSTNNISYAVSTYSNPTAAMHTFMLNRAAATPIASYWKNGAVSTSAVDNSSTSYVTALTAFAGAAIGASTISGTAVYFNGDLGEIIVYNRALKTEERQAIESYLSKKYGITVS